MYNSLLLPIQTHHFRRLLQNRLHLRRYKHPVPKYTDDNRRFRRRRIDRLPHYRPDYLLHWLLLLRHRRLPLP